jgi:uncharacterized protein
MTGPGLRFNVAGLLKESAGAARDYDVRVSPEALASYLDDAHPIGPLTGQVRMLRTPRSVFVRGHLDTRVEVECGRCLAATEVPLSFDLETEYYPEIDIVTGQHLPAPNDDLAFTIDHNHELDLGEAVRQHLLLEIPMQTLCDEACRGLCPNCGQNLNEGPCDCPGEEADERFTPLRALLERSSTVTQG